MSADRAEKQEGFPGERLVVVPRPMVTMAMQQPLLKQLLPTDAGYYPHAQGHTCTRERGCPETVFIYCARGSGWCEVAGRRHDVAKNQLVVIPAATPHVYGAEEPDPWTIHWFHAIGSNVPHYLERLQVSVEKPVVRLAADVQLLSLFEEVVRGLEHGSNLTHLTYAAHSLMHLMGVLLRHKDEYWQSQNDMREQVIKSIEFMKEHLREPLRISTLCAVANLSRSHYTTLFRRVTGYAPLMYLNHLRMQRAVQLLNTTSLSIKSISDQLGFSEQFYFSRAFRRLHGHSPTEHRQRYSA